MTLDSNITVFSGDIDSNATGRFFSEKFFLLKRADSRDFINDLLQLCVSEKVDIILPLVTKELFKLSKNKKKFQDKKIKVIVSDFNALSIANNKGLLYEHLSKNGISLPSYKIVKTKEELTSFSKDLGYPKKKIVVKPCISNGSRGVRILDASYDNYYSLFNNKPSSLITNLEDYLKILGNKKFPDLILSEYLPGEELTIDTLVNDGNIYRLLIRTRNQIRSGISISGKFVKDSNVEKYVRDIIKNIKGLNGPIGFQLKKSKSKGYLLLESNPRLQGTSIASHGLGLNFPLEAVELSRGQKPIKIITKQNIAFSRYYEEIFYEY